VELGNREWGAERLVEAVQAFRQAEQAFREALKERTRNRVSFHWAVTQNKLGIALSRIGTVLAHLGDFEAGAARLEQAVKTHREVLDEWRQDRFPSHWAMVQNDLGTALRVLGELDPGTTRLEEAEQVLREALKVWLRDHMPLGWATVQHSLGGVLRVLGERKRDIVVMCQSLDCHIQAWKVFSVKAPFRRPNR
jgi:tetratricopeptide (TPR) repeat protein